MTRIWIWGVALVFLGAGVRVQAAPIQVRAPDGNLSLRLEIDHHLDRGIAWLRKRQDPARGGWGEGRVLETTALVLTVLMGNNNGSTRDLDPGLAQGYEFLTSRLVAGRTNEGKAASKQEWMWALPALFFLEQRPEIRELIRQGIARLSDSEPLSSWEDEFRRIEVLQTACVLNLAGERFGATPFRAERPIDPAGQVRFRYLEGVLLSWRKNGKKTGLESWRTWAKAAFAQDLKSTDVRLLEAMAKGLVAARLDRVTDGRGGEVDWREKLAVRLFDLQRRDGSWAGEIPAAETPEDDMMITCRAILALQILVKSL